MYRFLLRPKWIAFHLLCLVGVLGMLWLASWQLRRLDERKDFNAEVVARSELPPVPLDELLAEPDFTPDVAAWRRVTAAGVWLPQQIDIFNRSQGGLAGDNVVTALVQDDGVTVLVNRGFVPLGTELPAPPSGDVEVLGTIRPSQARRTGELTDTGLAVTEARRIDIDRIAPQLPGEVAPVYLDLVSSDPAVQPGDPTPVPPPELSEGNHLSYAGQWFIFAACVAIGWVFAVRRSIRTRRRALTGESITGDTVTGGTFTAGSAGPAARDSRVPAGDEATTTNP